jgi:small nuclear ribonucleoprotein (snRNP)-like protein
MSQNRQFDLYMTADQNSPIAYVRKLLGRRMRVLLYDDCREIMGVFAALDSTARLTLRDGFEIFEDHACALGIVLIPLSQVHSMQLID